MSEIEENKEMGIISSYVGQLQKENEELKTILKGTTFCFDKEEHQRLIKENQELKKKLYSPDQTEFACPKCGEKFTTNYSREVYDLKKENEELKKQLEIKNDGFMASINETCEYATILEEYEKWLEEKIKYWEHQEEIWIKEGFMKFGGEANNKIIYKGCLDKLQELKEGKK